MIRTRVTLVRDSPTPLRAATVAWPRRRCAERSQRRALSGTRTRTVLRWPAPIANRARPRRSVDSVREPATRRRAVTLALPVQPPGVPAGQLSAARR